MKTTDNALNWFEIAVSDINRAKKFYDTIFDIEMKLLDMNGMKMASFIADDMSGKVSGALVQSDMHTPSMTGAVIYLNGNPDLEIPLAKVGGAGGKVLMVKTFVNEHVGYIAFFADTEGNKIALHSYK
jgi:predicted enzyme related to lactoylglutathione lyase